MNESHPRATITHMTSRLPLGKLTLGVALLSLAACGGATTQQMPVGQSPAPVAAPALDQVGQTPDVTTPVTVTPVPSQPVAPQPPKVDQPTIEGPGSTEPTPEPPPEPPPEPLTEPLAESADKPYVPNQAVLNNADNVACESDLVVFRQTMLELINASRIQARMCGDGQRDAAPILNWNNQLEQAAEMHGRDMAAHNFFSHDGSDGLSVADRVDAVDYPWRAVGENIAAGQTTHAEVHQGWLDSAGHCRNIMNQLFTEVGAACVSAPGNDFSTYWVVVFGDSK